MPALRYLPRYTVEDYRQWAGDWELWDGVPVAMTPSPFGKHQKLAAQLCRLLLNAIDASGCTNCEVLVECDWVISDDTVIRPDVSVVCGMVADRFIETPPTLIVEVLSGSTRDKDRTAKFDLYQRQGVRYYLMIDSETGSTEAFHQEAGGRYNRIPDASTLTLTLHEFSCYSCVSWLKTNRSARLNLADLLVTTKHTNSTKGKKISRGVCIKNFWPTRGCCGIRLKRPGSDSNCHFRAPAKRVAINSVVFRTFWNGVLSGFVTRLRITLKSVATITKD